MSGQPVSTQHRFVDFLEGAKLVIVAAGGGLGEVI